MVHQPAPSPAANSPSAVEAYAAATTTSSPATEEISAFIAGFVAGEGTFTRCRDSFTFAVQLGAVDGAMCEALSAFFAVGHLGQYERRRQHYDDVAVFAVRKTKDLVEVIVPFMDEHLPPSYKRRQYEEWRAGLLDYWQNRARRRRPCTVDDCERPQKGRGVCRIHYYAFYGE